MRGESGGWWDTGERRRKRMARTIVFLNSGPQIAALAEQVKELKETVNILISQIHGLRSDVKNKNVNQRRTE